MTKFEWAEIFELGVPEIDADHRKMFALAKRVGSAVSAGDHALCAEATAEFHDFSLAHFEREEAYLRQAGYGGIDEHAEFHARLLEKAKTMRRACEDLQEGEDLADCYRQVVAFMVDDIVRGDLQFKSFLEEQGIIVRTA